jgi:hypothetical protein
MIAVRHRQAIRPNRRFFPGLAGAGAVLAAIPNQMRSMPSSPSSRFCRRVWITLISCLFALPASAASPPLFAARNDSSPFLLFAIFVGVALAAIGISAYFEHKRRAALQQTAAQLGFQFMPDASVASALAGAGGFDLFSLGRSPRVSNCLEGSSSGVHISIFDYQYTTGSGKNRSTHHQTVLRFRVEGAALPAFTLRPESLFHKIGSAFGYQDIDFATHPKFSSHYLLRGPEAPAIRQAFTPTVLDFFENQQPFCVEAAGPCMIAYRHHHRVKPENIPPFLETGLTILSVFGIAQLTLGEDGRIGPVA